MKALHTITWVLLVIGGLNWGLTAFHWNAVEKILGAWPNVVMVIYVLVGLSALYEIFNHKNTCKMCNPGMMNKPTM